MLRLDIQQVVRGGEVAEAHGVHSQADNVGEILKNRGQVEHGRLHSELQQAADV